MLTTTETLLKELAAGNETRWARFYRDYAPFLEDFTLANSLCRTKTRRKSSAIR